LPAGSGSKVDHGGLIRSQDGWRGTQSTIVNHCEWLPSLALRGSADWNCKFARSGSWCPLPDSNRHGRCQPRDF